MMADKTKSYDPFFWKDPVYLKGTRERLGVSQQELARESGITRAVIANLESGRSGLHSVDDALSIYRALATRERIGGSSSVQAQSSARNSATKAVLGLLRLTRKSHQERLATIDQKLKQLQREREATQLWLQDVESEEKALLAKDKET
jgi:transcriptional regulator with XRE-family HTH domain